MRMNACVYFGGNSRRGETGKHLVQNVVIFQVGIYARLSPLFKFRNVILKISELMDTRH